ncbi:MAG: hypothetical protein QNJ51_18850 [Calothrix sp. MO_167.B12]|nr:hypothetical protein [Calothrix sp. MO_167.B12]
MLQSLDVSVALVEAIAVLIFARLGRAIADIILFGDSFTVTLQPVC